MDKERFETGLAQRKSTLGAEYVANSLAAADDFNRPFQEMMTEWCWGFGWGDEVIEPKTRSMMNLTMIAALGRMHEWELHFNGAITHVIAIYAGVPAGVECFRIAKKVFAERGMG
jgi:4-carboxymuconolactone decarboxylase